MPKRNPKASPKSTAKTVSKTALKKAGNASTTARKSVKTAAERPSKERTKSKAGKKTNIKAETNKLLEVKKHVTTEDLETKRVLAIDIGGTNVKLLLNGETEPRKFPSSKEMTPAAFIEEVHNNTEDWDYNCVSIGYPGLTGPNGPLSEPGNLGPGWVAFDFQSAFGVPVKIMNDAAMQALGSYEGGRMLFLGFGTGLGSTLICHSTVISLELGNIRWNDKFTSGEMLGRRALNKLGKKKWRKIAWSFINSCIKSFNADYIVVGGGNAKVLGPLPPGVRRGHNQTAFRGGFRLFGVEDMPTTTHETLEHDKKWRLL